METFRMAGDNNRLYFKNYERRPDDEEFAEVMKILKEEGAIISDKYIAPDCDWYHNCIIGEGTFLYAENTETLVILERLFKNNHNINIQ